MQRLSLLCCLLLLVQSSCAPLTADDAATQTSGDAAVCSPCGEFLLITELMAAGQTILPDEDNHLGDWIELYNPGPLTVQLSGWSLTDNPEQPQKWTFPTRALAPGELLVVFASGKDRAGQQLQEQPVQLHTNFRLDSKGEYLGLYRPGNPDAVFAYAPQFAEQQQDVSYGMAFSEHAAEPDRLLFFDQPTPGEKNGDGAPGVTQPPQFLNDGDLFVGQKQVRLHAVEANATVRYTVDGSLPDTSSPVWTGALLLEETTGVLLRAFVEDKLASPVVGKTFLEISPTLASFSSNLPLLVLHTGQSVPDGPLLGGHITVLQPDTGGRSTLLDVPHHSGYLGLRTRGTFSAWAPKKHFAVELRDRSQRDLAIPLLGLPEESDWVLHAPYSDKSLLRNFLAYQCSNKMLRYASRSRFVEVFLKDNTDPLGPEDYQGLYLLLEKIKRDRNRVDLTKLEFWHNQAPEISGGYLLRRDWPDPGEQGIHTDRGVPLTAVTPEETVITAHQRRWITDYLNTFETALFSPHFADPHSGYRAHIDVASFVDHHLLVEMTRNIDGLRLSAYMHKDRGGPINMGPYWDCNLCFGLADYQDGWRSEGWYQAPLGSGTPTISEVCSTATGDHRRQCVPDWWPRLFADPDFVTRYKRRWSQLRQGPFATATLHREIDSAVDVLAEAAERNFERWPELGRHVAPNYHTGQTWLEEVDYLKRWLEQRCLWMDGQLQED